MQDSADMMETIDLREYLAVLRKWRWVVALITTISILTAVLLSFFVLPPVYETKVTMLVTQPSTQRQVREETGVQAVVNAVSRLPEMTLNTYVGQVLSPYFLDRVATVMKFDKSVLGAKELSNLINAKVIKDTNLIEVTVRNTDPVLAADIANTLSREFLEFISQNVQEQMSKSVKFLQDQLTLVKKDLDHANNKMKVMKSEASGMDILQNEVSARLQILSQCRAQLVSARSEEALIVAGLNKAKELLEAARRSRAALEQQNPENPEGAAQALGATPATDAEIAALQGKVNEKEITLAEKRAQVAELEARVQEISAQVTEMQKQLVDKRIEQEQLAKQIAQMEETYRLLSDRILQAQMASSMNMGETSISVVSPALVPTIPVKPNKKLNVALAAVLGLFVSVGLSFVLEYLDNTIKTADDVRKHLELPTLGSIPVIE